jgi:hypothetical protein
MGIIQKAQAAKNECSHKNKCCRQATLSPALFPKFSFSILDWTCQKMYYLSGLSEKIVIATKEHVNQKS